LFERRSPINRRSSSDRVSTPLRRSWPFRRPALNRLSSSAMPLLHQTNTIYLVAEWAVNSPISSAGGMFGGKKADVDIARNRLGSAGRSHAYPMDPRGFGLPPAAPASNSRSRRTRTQTMKQRADSAKARFCAQTRNIRGKSSQFRG